LFGGLAGQHMEHYFVAFIIAGVVFTIVGLLIGYLWDG
jgi:hypothetical protein